MDSTIKDLTEGLITKDEALEQVTHIINTCEKQKDVKCKECHGTERVPSEENSRGWDYCPKCFGENICGNCGHMLDCENEYPCKNCNSTGDQKYADLLEKVHLIQQWIEEQNKHNENPIDYIKKQIEDHEHWFHGPDGRPEPGY